LEPAIFAIIKCIFYFGPLIFAFGFIAPLITAIISQAGLELPSGVTPIMVGLALGGLWGVYAQIKGRWL